MFIKAFLSWSILQSEDHPKAMSRTGCGLLAMPCVFVPAMQEVGTVKPKAIPTEVMEKMILTAQLEFQYAKSSLFTCPASWSGWCVQGQQGGYAALNNLMRKRVPWKITAPNYYFEPSSTQWNSPKIVNQWLTAANALNWKTAAPQGACEASRQKLQLPGAGWGLPQEISTAPGTHSSSSCSPTEEMNRVIFSSVQFSLEYSSPLARGSSFWHSSFSTCWVRGSASSDFLCQWKQESGLRHRSCYLRLSHRPLRGRSENMCWDTNQSIY